LNGLSNENHPLLRKAVEEFVAREITPHVDQWESECRFPRELYRKWGEAGYMGAGYPEEYGGIPATLSEQMVICEALTGSGSPGLAASLGSHSIAMPPVVHNGTDEQKRRLLPPVLSGEKIAALAITEPDTGSNVAGVRTHATLDGDAYIVNGAKMFITSGTRADFLTTAVRTGGPGVGGISVLVIESDTPGVVQSKSLPKMGWAASDTAEIGFQNVRVPIANRIGEENQGFLILMQNFAFERLMLSVMAVKMAEMAFNAAKEYSSEREVFGKPIQRFQVQRHRLAEMATRLAVARAYTQKLTDKLEANEPCIAEVAMCKNFTVEASTWVIDQALQIHGGYGYMREYLVERLYRDIRLYSIGGGTNEIMREIIAKQLGI